MNPEVVHNILEKHQQSQDGLISILEDIQRSFGYLPSQALQQVAEESGRNLVDIYGVATFYKSFSLKPRGKHLISVCLGTACHVRGAPSIAEEFEKSLKIEAGETTEDQEFTLETVNCLGACALGPVVVVDGHYFPNVKRTAVAEIIAKTREGIDKIEVKTDQRVFPIEVSCPRCNHSLMDTMNLVDGHPCITVTASFNRKHGRLSMSCLYGSYNIASEHVIPPDIVLNLFCPHCHAELSGGANCAECGTPMVPMIVRSGGVVQVCPRRGCKGHLLDLSE
ncbi:NAD(P)H-dependent oxidoreductase subunit E [bacterium]|nr:NAD(P)H-dependent oxidoreductase subunit E [bacterium]MBU1652925.1 NAD(P)H-dependent oxidoreductase subunit E [bacterium]MBU1882368.1 NAD(P)H-dependent oxidoreductase subunit E [bacterium]